MRVRWVSHTRKYTQWNIFLFESSDKSPYWTNPYHIGFRCEASLNFHTYFGHCPNDTYILLHFPLYVCSNYPHTGLTTATAPSGHQMAVITCDRSIGKTPVRIILWCPTTKMLIKARFLIQPLEQEGGCQNCCMCLCNKVFINHFYQMKANPECLKILIYWSRYWVDRLRRTLRRKV